MKRFLIIALTILATSCTHPQTQSNRPRIAVVLPSSATDMSWSQSLCDSLRTLKDVDVQISENLYNVNDAAAAIRDYAQSGADIVIAHGAQYEAAVKDVAKDFPDTTFAYGTGNKPGPNVFAYDAAAQEGGYLNGLLAAKLTKSGVIGVIGPVQAGDAKTYVEGFLKGAKTGNAKVSVTWTGSFSDTALAAEAASVHIQNGADVLTGSAQQVTGAVGIARDRHAWWLGTQTDQSPLAPTSVACCQVYDWTPILQDILQQRKSNVRGGKAYTLTLRQGLAMVVNPGAGIQPRLLEPFNKARADILSGALKP